MEDRRKQLEDGGVAFKGVTQSPADPDVIAQIVARAGEHFRQARGQQQAVPPTKVEFRPAGGDQATARGVGAAAYVSDLTTRKTTGEKGQALLKELRDDPAGRYLADLFEHGAAGGE